jgi:UDP-N-acetylmuramate dehydrogenase
MFAQSLQHLNTFGLAARAEDLATIEHLEDLQRLHQSEAWKGRDLHILGGGSNVLLTQDLLGLVLLNRIQGRQEVYRNPQVVHIEFGGGENWHEAVLWAVAKGLGGLENMSLIPGTVGAAPIQNIGAYGVELKDRFVYLEAFDLESGKTQRFNRTDCQFGYRDSIFKGWAKGRYFITHVCLELDLNPTVNLRYGDIAATLDAWGIDQPNITDVSRAVIHIRQSKLPDPRVLGNCGSFFKNPVIPTAQFERLQERIPEARSYAAGEGLTKVPAGWLIEHAGWKGHRAGAVGVHEKQALVLVNYGGAQGSQVLQLARAIQADIFERYGIALEMEVNTW